jgi:hypothetical protein
MSIVFLVHTQHWLTHEQTDSFSGPLSTRAGSDDMVSLVEGAASEELNARGDGRLGELEMPSMNGESLPFGGQVRAGYAGSRRAAASDCACHSLMAFSRAVLLY